jgi:hypothetical protein
MEQDALGGELLEKKYEKEKRVKEDVVQPRERLPHMRRMNGWKRLMEQDALRGELLEKKHEKEKRMTEGVVQPRERLSSDEEFLVFQPKKNMAIEDKQKIINSVKLTKALVLLGYSCWSDLEPGKHFDVHTVG